MGDNRNSFRRQNLNRKSLREGRCYSVVVTQKEIELLRKQENKENQSPKPNPGFVKSMCRFYSDVFTSGGKQVQRSNSCSENKDKHGNQKSAKPSPLEIRRSCSFQDKSLGEVGEPNIEEFVERSYSESPQLSPTWQSVKSQDSGFSDSGESEGGRSPELNIYFVQGTVDKNIEKLSGSLSTVSSLQTGLRLKLEGEPRSLHQTRTEIAKSMFKADCNSASKLIHFINARNREKVLQSKTLSPESPLENSVPLRAKPSGPMFSTPLRSSFRQRPRTITCIEEAHTPVKVEPRSKLREIKNRRRLSHSIQSLRGEQLNKTWVHETIIEHGDNPTLLQDTQSNRVNLDLSGRFGEASELNASQTDPVYEWWRDLLVMTDSECMTYLQSKPILPRIGQPTISQPTSEPPTSGRTASSLASLLSKPSLNVQRINYILENNTIIQETVNQFTR